LTFTEIPVKFPSQSFNEPTSDTGGGSDPDGSIPDPPADVHLDATGVQVGGIHLEAEVVGANRNTNANSEHTNANSEATNANSEQFTEHTNGDSNPNKFNSDPDIWKRTDHSGNDSDGNGYPNGNHNDDSNGEGNGGVNGNLSPLINDMGLKF
jgi:hypothetical protein